MSATIALVHVECGHAAGLAVDDEALDDLRRDSAAKGLTSPQWEVFDLDMDDAIERLLAGPCGICRIEQTAS